MCSCTICKAKELGVDTKQVYFGLDSEASKLVEINPDLKIYQYEAFLKDHGDSALVRFKKKYGPVA